MRERYLRRWKGERLGGGVEFEASLLGVLRRRAQEKCIPLFFEPVPADHLRPVPPAITADPVILRSATFSPEDRPEDARSDPVPRGGGRVVGVRERALTAGFDIGPFAEANAVSPSLVVGLAFGGG